MNFENILGLKTQPFSSDNSMGRLVPPSLASQDFTRISNSPKKYKRVVILKRIGMDKEKSLKYFHPI